MRRLWDALRTLAGRRGFEGEMTAEFAAHLELLVDDLMARGVPRAEAVRRARASFGSIEGAKDESRMARGVAWVDELRGDLRYTFRTLRSSPGYTGVAVLTLALGIGANTTIFSVVNGVVLEPLPFPASDRLVHITIQYPWGALWTYRREARSYEGVAGYGYGSQLNLFTADQPERIRGREVSAEFFQVLGVDAALGRTWRTGEDAPGAAPVAIISHGLWQRRFGGDPAVIGTTALVDGTAREIVGVMPARFSFPVAGTEVWVPVALDPARQEVVWGGGGTTLIGRLAAGVRVSGADAEHRSLITRVRDAFPWRMPDRYGQATDNHVRPLAEVTSAGVVGRLSLLLGAAAMVLLVACANLANLNLTRLVGREREIAVRQAIGGTRFRVARQLVVEQLVLASLGAMLGVGVALVGLPLLVSFLPPETPRLDEVRLDRAVLGFTAAIAAAAAVLASLGPLFRLPRANRVEVFAVSSKNTGSPLGRGRLTGLLVSLEVAIAVVLVVGAGILLRSLLALHSVDPGFRTDRIVTATISPNPTWCKDEAGPCTCEVAGTCRAFFPAAEEQLAALPGVKAAALANLLPLARGQIQFPMEIEDHPVVPGQSAHMLGMHVVSTGYFGVLGIPVLEGRPFGPGDRGDTEPVVIVNRTLAARYWPGRSPLGKQLKPVWMPKMATIVGVVGDVRYDGLAQERPTDDFYFPMTQWGQGEMNAVIRTEASAAALEPGIRRAVATIDRTAAVSRVEDIGTLVLDSTASSRTTATLLALFAGLALALGAVGIYGVLSYRVSGRRREIGIRMAIGAEPGEVRRMVIGEAGRLVVGGLAIGLAFAWLGASALRGFVYGVEVRDPVTFGLVPAVIVAVGAVASYLPARRATRVSPVEVMRAD